MAEGGWGGWLATVLWVVWLVVGCCDILRYGPVRSVRYVATESAIQTVRLAMHRDKSIVETAMVSTAMTTAMFFQSPDFALRVTHKRLDV